MDNRHRPVPSQTKTPKIHARAPAPKSGPEELVQGRLAPAGVIKDAGLSYALKTPAPSDQE